LKRIDVSQPISFLRQNYEEGIATHFPPRGNVYYKCSYNYLISFYRFNLKVQFVFINNNAKINSYTIKKLNQKIKV
jgi:hypothetical protein